MSSTGPARERVARKPVQQIGGQVEPTQHPKQVRALGYSVGEVEATSEGWLAQDAGAQHGHNTRACLASLARSALASSASLVCEVQERHYAQCVYKSCELGEVRCAR